MYYPQQSPGMSQKLPAHHDQSNPWNRHLGVGVNPQPQPPTSPGYTMYTNGAIMQLPHMPPMQHHHHQNSLGHYPSPPSHQQQSPAAQPISTHWQQQLMKYEVCFRSVFMNVLKLKSWRRLCGQHDHPTTVLGLAQWLRGVLPSLPLLSRTRTSLRRRTILLLRH
jgi:hypothetical protein